MDRVISLEARRAKPIPEYDGIVCPKCRSAWFETYATFEMGEDGRVKVTGWIADVECAECGEQQRL